jgi:ATP-dependent Zn protease
MAKCGMFGIDLVYNSGRDYDIDYSDERMSRLNLVFDETIKDCYERAKNVLQTNKNILEKLTSDLAEKEILQIEESNRIIEELGGIR